MRLSRRLRTASALACCAALGGCKGVLDPFGPVGAAERTILLNAVAIMLCIVVPTIAATIGVAWWFRAGNRRAVHLPHWEYSGKLEMVVWGVPAMTVMLLAGICWVGSHDLDPPRTLPGPQPTLAVQVVALDWKWLFIYPREDLASVNRLVVPVGTKVDFMLTSATVMNSFFIPGLGSQIYAMGGMQTRLNLQADRPGTYEGRSVQFSGDGFSGMHFGLDAVSAADFAAWVDRAHASDLALDRASYARLAMQSKDVAPVLYRSVARGLFDDVVARRAPPPETMQQDHPQPPDAPHSANRPQAAPNGHDRLVVGEPGPAPR